MLSLHPTYPRISKLHVILIYTAILFDFVQLNEMLFEPIKIFQTKYSYGTPQY